MTGQKEEKKEREEEKENKEEEMKENWRRRTGWAGGSIRGPRGPKNDF